MDIIPIQAFAVLCERVFSFVKETMAPRQSCIAINLMEALQLLKTSVWNSGSLDFTSGLNYAEELKEMETKESINSHVLEDVHSFAWSLVV